MSILEQLKAQREAAKSKAPSRAPITPQDVDIRGTGLTKRAIERSEAAYEKEAEKAFTAETSLLKSDAEQKFAAAVEETAEQMRVASARGEVSLDPSQIEALTGLLHNRFSVLIGAAGTGKTTLERILCSELQKRLPLIDLRQAYYTQVTDEEGHKFRVRADNELSKEEPDMVPPIAVAAYTGRASQQSRRALPEFLSKSVSTIHKLLGFAPTEEDYIDEETGEDKVRLIFRPTFDAANKLPYKCFIFDEASMIPIPLWNQFIDAIDDDCRIILIGDINQLPPVYGKSVLGYGMRMWPVFELTQVHRQAAGSAIIQNAHNILNGRALENASNFHMIGLDPKAPIPSGQNTLQTYFLRVIKRMAEMGRYDPYRDTIIVPQNGGDKTPCMVGAIDLNLHLVNMFNPEKKENGTIVNKRIRIHTGRGEAFFAVGDKVMMTANINTAEPPITNGMIGIVESLNLNGRYDMKRSQLVDNDDDSGEIFTLDMEAVSDALSSMDDAKEEKEDKGEDQRQASHVMTIKFENGQSYAASTAGDFGKIVYGYAITCHKAQGGEYPNVIILCHSVNHRMLNREWLYTAVTRARDNVYIVCNHLGLEKALKTQKIKGTTLREKIRSYVIESKAVDGDLEHGEIDREKYPILWANEAITWDENEGVH